MNAFERGGPWDVLRPPCPTWFGGWPAQWRPTRPGELEWKNVSVDGRRAAYAVGGEGVPVVLLHGWALGHHAYKRSLKRLIQRGCRVYAPALPGFSGTADLPGRRRSLEGYGDWARRFMEAVAIEEPAMVIGHSFGGGVAIKLAHDFPEHVRYLVLLNSVGSPGTTGPRRAPWQWWWSFTREFTPPERGAQLMWATSEDFVPNLLRNPRALWEVGQLARSADLTAELQALAERDMPVLVLWGDDDRVIPLTSFDTLCSAIGVEGTVLSGNHCWMLADVDAFDEVMANVVEVARPARVRPAPAGTNGTGAHDGSGGTTELRLLLEATSVPADQIADAGRRGARPVADERTGVRAGRRPRALLAAARPGRGAGRRPPDLRRRPPHRRGHRPARPPGRHHRRIGGRRALGLRCGGRHVAGDGPRPARPHPRDGLGPLAGAVGGPRPAPPRHRDAATTPPCPSPRRATPS